MARRPITSVWGGMMVRQVWSRPLPLFLKVNISFLPKCVRPMPIVPLQLLTLWQEPKKAPVPSLRVRLIVSPQWSGIPSPSISSKRQTEVWLSVLTFRGCQGARVWCSTMCVFINWLTMPWFLTCPPNRMLKVLRRVSWTAISWLSPRWRATCCRCWPTLLPIWRMTSRASQTIQLVRPTACSRVKALETAMRLVCAPMPTCRWFVLSWWNMPMEKSTCRLAWHGVTLSRWPWRASYLPIARIRQTTWRSVRIIRTGALPLQVIMCGSPRFGLCLWPIALSSSGTNWATPRRIISISCWRLSAITSCTVLSQQALPVIRRQRRMVGKPTFWQLRWDCSPTMHWLHNGSSASASLPSTVTHRKTTQPTVRLLTHPMTIRQWPISIKGRTSTMTIPFRTTTTSIPLIRMWWFRNWARPPWRWSCSNRDSMAKRNGPPMPWCTIMTRWWMRCSTGWLWPMVNWLCLTVTTGVCSSMTRLLLIQQMPVSSAIRTL